MALQSRLAAELANGGMRGAFMLQTSRSSAILRVSKCGVLLLQRLLRQSKGNRTDSSKWMSVRSWPRVSCAGTQKITKRQDFADVRLFVLLTNRSTLHQSTLGLYTTRVYLHASSPAEPPHWGVVLFTWRPAHSFRMGSHSFTVFL